MLQYEKEGVQKGSASLEVAHPRRSSRASSSNLKNLGSCNTQLNKEYQLNKVKAMEKKAEACSREQISYEMKPGKNFVAEFSSAAYEVTKRVIKESLETDHVIQTEYCVKTEIGTEQSGAEVELRYKLFQKRKDGEPGCYSKLTINFYHTSSRMLSNGARVDIFMDRIFPDLLLKLKRQYNNIDIMDRNMSEAISKSLEGHDKPNPTLRPLTNGTFQGKVHDSSEQLISTNKGPIDITQVKDINEPAVYQDCDIEAEDYAECPVCEEGAMTNVIQCEDFTMWFHYECVGLSKEKARKIPDSNPFVCINCNDQKLYENPSTETKSSIQIQSAFKMN